MKIATLYFRVLVAWLIAMQPMTGAYAAAASALSPLAMELCSGNATSGETLPAAARGHLDCCLASAPTAALPGETISLKLSGQAPAANEHRRPAFVTVAQAGLGPQAARAPPL